MILLTPHCIELRNQLSFHCSAHHVLYMAFDFRQLCFPFAILHLFNRIFRSFAGVQLGARANAEKFLISLRLYFWVRQIVLIFLLSFDQPLSLLLPVFNPAYWERVRLIILRCLFALWYRKLWYIYVLKSTMVGWIRHRNLYLVLNLLFQFPVVLFHWSLDSLWFTI